MRILYIYLFVLATINWAGAQDIHFTDVEKLEKINTTAEESQPMVSPGGDTLFFIRAQYKHNTGGEFSGHDIWYSTRIKNGWSEAKNAMNKLNNADNNAVVGINYTADHIYLINTYSPPVRRDRGVVFAKKDGGKWGSPRELDIVIDNKSHFYGFYMHPDEDVLVISMNSNPSRGLEDLYVSIKTAEGWNEPVNLGNVINTESYEISPFLSANKDSLFFASNGRDGLGDADIYVSRRLGHGWEEWSEPVNLGGPINSEAFDAYFFKRGNEAFFSSNRDGDNDLYTAKIVKQIVEEKEFALISTKDKVEDDTTTTVTISNPDSAAIKKDTPIKYELDQKIHFAFDSYKLNAEDIASLDLFLEKIKTNGVLKQINVTGYTDNIGAEAYNKQLSEKRTEVIVHFLKEKGISNEVITAEAKGESNPVAPNTTSKGRQKNRRVEIVVNMEK